MQKLINKTALITGGNSGIGFATAKLFIEEGARVIITGRDAQRIDEAVQKLGDHAHGILSDAGNMNDLQALSKKVALISPAIDIVFANAGAMALSPFAQATETVFDTNIDVNLKGAFFTVQQLLPLMSSGGSIIFNATIAIHRVMEGQSALVASKGALLSLTRSLAVELAARNIRVNCVSPGAIITPGMGKTGIDAATLQQFAEQIRTTIPMKRFGEAEEVAKTVLFFASDDSSYVTGSELIVDGGKTAVW